MKIKSTVVVYTTPRTKEQKLSLDTVKRILKKYKIRFVLADRDKLKKDQFKHKDIVIAVGGDGTFLRAAQFIESTPIFGVNAEPSDKEGFFMESYKGDFEKKLGMILHDEFKIRKLARLEARVSGKRIDSLALNEFFIGPRKSYHASKYIINVRGKKERHKSSGILVSTPAGSNAWTSASRGNRMKIDDEKFQFVVREPYEGKVFKDYRLKNGFLSKNERIEIVSEMLDGILVADSVGKEFPIKHGQKIKIGLSNNPVSSVYF